MNSVLHQSAAAWVHLVNGRNPFAWPAWSTVVGGFGSGNDFIEFLVAAEIIFSEADDEFAAVGIGHETKSQAVDAAPSGPANSHVRQRPRWFGRRLIFHFVWLFPVNHAKTLFVPASPEPLAGT